MTTYYISCTATPVVTAVTESPLIVLEDMAITLIFTVTESLPPVLLTSSDWRFNSTFGTHTINPEDPHFSFAADFMSLTINPVGAENEGTYTLTAHNEEGLMGSAHIVVDVQCKWLNYFVLWKGIHDGLFSFLPLPLPHPFSL